MKTPADIRFDGWTLNAGSGELVKDGVRVRLQSQPLVILQELLARPGEVVTREQLIARLWPRGVVDFDTALNSAVRRLRTALGEHADAVRYIETIPKRGYRFIGQLEQAGDTSREAPVLPTAATVERMPSRAHWRAAAAVALGAAVWLLVATASRPGATGGGVTAGVPTAPGPVTSVSPGAQSQYALARHLLQRRGEGDVTRSLEYFGQVVEVAPQFAAGWAGLASAYWLETVEGRLPADTGLPAVRAAAERALELDPFLAEARVRLANYWWRSGRREIGGRHLEQAIAADPDHPLVLSMLASLAAGEGRLEEAIVLQRRGVTADPLSRVSRHNLAVWLYLSGRTDEARDVLLETREIYPFATDSDGLLSRTLVLGRQYEPAVAAAQSAPDDDDRLQSLALAYFGLGRRAQAEASLREMLELPPTPDPVRVAEVYAYAGQPDLAFEWLRRATEADEAQRCARSGCLSLEMATQSPFLTPLHSDPRWKAWSETALSRGTMPASPRRG
jgi:DNA-binding winged helix-turn-helix (wHTH) protein/Tfp pilus assembly protein PilF